MAKQLTSTPKKMANSEQTSGKKGLSSKQISAQVESKPQPVPRVSPIDLSQYEIESSPDFSRADLLQFLTSLVRAKNEILARSKERIDGGEIALDHNEMTDQVDMASMSVEQNVIFKLLDRDRQLLAEINRAIKKIETGDYGYCEGSGDVIPHKRLELTPWTRYSVQYQEQLEKSRQ